MNELPPVKAATAWSTNADMILDVVRLGYIRPDDWVLDPTYGNGKWWTRYKHTSERFAELDRKFQPGWDFCNAQKWFSVPIFDVITFDPPYVSTGGRKTSTIYDFNDDYGIGNDSPRTPGEMQALINAGMYSLHNDCLVKGGLLMVKCMPYISSGKYFDAPYFTTEFADSLGMETIDKLVHVGEPGIQPPGRRQVHARNNASYLLVFRKKIS